jgi:spore germination protein BB
MTNNTISAKQMGLFIMSAQIGAGIIMLPSALAKFTGHDGWISVLAAGMVATLTVVVIVILMKKFPGQGILEIQRELFGSFLGTGLNILFLLYLIMITFVILRIFIELIGLVFVGLFPPLFLSLLILTPTVYLTMSGLKPVCRFSGVVIFILILILIVFWLTRNHFRSFFLMPVGAAGLKSLMVGFKESIYAYLGLEMIAFIHPMVSDSKNSLKWAVVANLISTVFYILVTLVTTAVYGEKMLAQLVAPLFKLPGMIKIPIFERLDLLFIIWWFPLLEGVLRSYFFTTVQSITRILPVKLNIDRRLLILLFAAVVIYLSRIPGSFIQVLAFLKIVNLAGVMVIGLLYLCYLYSLIKKRC